jgi:methylmalonyl-CoA/ethylmalonyl-CoA epimerase
MSLDINKIEHIGIAVKSLAASIPLFEKLLDTKCYKVEEVSDQLVRTAFFKVGEIKVELLEPIDNAGPIASFLEKKGEGLHHIAFQVASVNSALLEAKSKGFKLIDNIARQGAEGLKIGFLNPKTTNNCLIELCSYE